MSAGTALASADSKVAGEALLGDLNHGADAMGRFKTTDVCSGLGDRSGGEEPWSSRVCLGEVKEPTDVSITNPAALPGS